jgi:hypothetical protein
MPVANVPRDNTYKQTNICPFCSTEVSDNSILKTAIKTQA